MTEVTGAQLRQDFQNRIDGARARSVAVVSDAGDQGRFSSPG